MTIDQLEVLSRALDGRYTVEHELGRGGMGVVFTAQDLLHKRKVAIKVLRGEFRAAGVTDRFLREIQIVTHLQHPNIVPLFDSGEADGLPYYVMPLLEGESLRKHLDQLARLSADEVVRIVRDVASALDYAHGHNVVHRDVKPENILLISGRAVLLDFGVARAVAAVDSGRLSSSGIALGTPNYMSPEQWSADSAVDGRTDTYALACVTYEMFAGLPPFYDRDALAIRAKQVERPPNVTVVRNDLPAAVQGVLEKGLDKFAANRFSTAVAFSEALEQALEVKPESERQVLVLPRKKHLRWAGVGAALIMLAVVAGLLVRPWSRVSATPNLLAVAPFDVMVPELAYWREGLADLVARSLDGTGALRSVPPTVVLRAWQGRNDALWAPKLARQTGAGLAVLGLVVRSGHDSVRLTARVVDLLSGRNLFDLEIREAQDRIDRAADSLSFRLLVALNANPSTGGGRLASVGSQSLPAVKAFLRGEYFFRRTAWDSARAHYQQAVDLDPTFALALLRLSLVSGWQSEAFAIADSFERNYAFEAGRLNHGLAIRDSLVVTAESLRAALTDPWEDTLFQEHRRRLFLLLDQATRRYPGDPEMWYQLGLARLLVPSATPAEEVLETFDRGIRLDSTFAPSYLYPVMQGMLVRGPDAARRYLAAYLALNPTDVHADGLRLAALLLEPARNEDSVVRLLAAAPAQVLNNAYDVLAWWVDSTESAVRLERLSLTRPGVSRVLRGSTRTQLSAALAYRGHVKEAFEVLGDRATHPKFWAVFLTLGALPPDTTARLLQEIALEPLWPPNGIVFAIPWWAEQGDRAMLQLVQRRADSLASASTHSLARPYARLLATSAAAHLLGAAGPSDTLLRVLGQLNDSACAAWDCYYTRLDRARLLAAAGRPAEAAALLDAETPKTYYPLAVLWRLERARLAVKLGRPGQARKDYQYVIDAWARADPPLQRWVKEAKEALGQLKKTS